MTFPRIAIPLLALLIGAWLIYDGMRAFTRGDYTTPRSGAHAGQLGPWSRLVSALGLNPRGTAMKWVHVLLGFFWLIAAVAYLLAPHLGWRILLGASFATLWYFPIGTIVAVAELGLLFYCRCDV